jgi:hypothetical protein
MSDFNWDSFANGDFIKFNSVGDTIAGEVLAVGLGTDFGGAACPKLTIRTAEGDDKIVNAGQKVLQSRLAEVRPQVGEKVAIVYSADGTAKPGQTAAKLFTVQVRGADGSLRQAPEAEVTTDAAAPTAAVPPPPGAQPAASSLV